MPPLIVDPQLAAGEGLRAAIPRYCQIAETVQKGNTAVLQPSWPYFLGLGEYFLCDCGAADGEPPRLLHATNDSGALSADG